MQILFSLLNLILLLGSTNGSTSDNGLSINRDNHSKKLHDSKRDLNLKSKHKEVHSNNVVVNHDSIHSLTANGDIILVILMRLFYITFLCFQ